MLKKCIKRHQILLSYEELKSAFQTNMQGESRFCEVTVSSSTYFHSEHSGPFSPDARARAAARGASRGTTPAGTDVGDLRARARLTYT